MKNIANIKYVLILYIIIYDTSKHISIPITFHLINSWEFKSHYLNNFATAQSLHLKLLLYVGGCFLVWILMVLESEISVYYVSEYNIWTDIKHFVLLKLTLFVHYFYGLGPRGLYLEFQCPIGITVLTPPIQRYHYLLTDF